MSRQHATIGAPVGGGIPTLIDRGGRNGTFVNGSRRQGTVPLLCHAVVRLGDTLSIVNERAPTVAEDEGPLPGRSPAIAAIRAALPRVAADRAPVLVCGESGTGKELLAAEIHGRSGRRGPLIKFNCAELSPSLVESQLFGHERGAFTGATAPQPGLFVTADGGTLLLDEVAEIPLELQAKLLRVLEEGEVRPLGSSQVRRVNVRLVCATNVDLLERVDSGRFRRDLFARLSYLELRLPPLRERKRDILFWLEHFRRRWCAERREDTELSLRPSVAERVLVWPWPDNLRGLNRLVHRLLSSGERGDVGMRALEAAMPELCPPGASGRPSEPSVAAPARPLSDRPTRDEFIAVYRANGESVRATSKHFGRDRRQVYRWLEQFGIERRAADDDDGGDEPD